MAIEYLKRAPKRVTLGEAYARRIRFAARI
jgi:hypothetical protein